MKSLTLVIVGVLLAISGTIFTVQGLGFLRGSVMTGDPLWTVLGPLIALAGVVLIVVGARRRASELPVSRRRRAGPRAAPAGR